MNNKEIKHKHDFYLFCRTCGEEQKNVFKEHRTHLGYTSEFVVQLISLLDSERESFRDEDNLVYESISELIDKIKTNKLLNINEYNTILFFVLQQSFAFDTGDLE